MIKEKTYQYALTADECGLFRRLRELESKYETEYPLIYNGTEPILQKPMSLTLEAEGRQIARFDVDGSQLIKQCASISMQIVLNLLTPKEDLANPRDDSTEDEASRDLRSEEAGEDMTVALENTPDSVVPKGPVIWKELFPPCVQEVSVFVAPQDMNAEVQDDLRARFPDVSVVFSHSSARNATTIDGAQLLVPSGADVAEHDPGIGSLTSTTSQFANTFKKRDQSPALRVQDQAGSRSPIINKAVHAMRKHWNNSHEIKPFNATPKTSLDRFYRDLVTLYIHGYQRKESDLCFAVQLQFQSTNFSHRDNLPDLETSVLAFEFLPEEDSLCRWIATLFAFLWKTRQYETQEEVLKSFNRIHSDAFCKFIFAVAYMRDLFTKGHNTAVLDEWCQGHHHTEGSKDEVSCRAALDSLSEVLDSIRISEAKDEYEEAMKLVEDYEKKAKMCSTETGTGPGIPSSSKKRSNQSTVERSRKRKPKRW